jgi:hypothetical protein
VIEHRVDDDDGREDRQAASAGLKDEHTLHG